MKIVYLTWGETPRSYGVFGSQVIQQFVATKQAMPDSDFSFVSGVPLIHSGMIREKLSYTKELEKVRSNLNNINFSCVPIYTTQNFVNSSQITHRFMHFGAHHHLANKLRKQQPDILHCRGYHATYAALKVRKKYNFNYKVVFDARGLWPEEVSLKKHYNETNKNYLFLKEIEQWCLDNSDRVISVSTPMTKHYNKLTNTNINTIYLSAPASEIMPPINNSSEEVTLVYVGALSEDTWHQPNILADLYKSFRTHWEKTKLIIVSTSNHKKIQSKFSKFPKNEVVITSTKSQNDLAKVLLKANFSCLPYFVPKTDREKVISSTVLAVKTVEYLSAGLPVLCNKYCGGAASLIADNELGVTYDPTSHQEINKSNLEKFLSIDFPKKSCDFSRENFSYETNAHKYKKVYLDLYNA